MPNISVSSVWLNGVIIAEQQTLSVSCESGLKFSITHGHSTILSNFNLEQPDIERLSFRLNGIPPCIQVDIMHGYTLMRIAQSVPWLKELIRSDTINILEFCLFGAFEMVQLESVLSGLASNVAEFRNIPSLPGEIWTRILSFSECPERCNAELVSHKLKEAAEANWSLQRRLEIDLRANTHNKVLALLKRCGQQLEEISTRQHLPQPYGGEPLGQLCPNLKGLAFCGGSGFCLTDCPTQLTSENYRGDLDRLFTSFSLLERLEFYSTFVLLWSAANVVITTSELIRGLVNVTSLRELHLFEMESQSDWSNISKLQQLRVLSVRVRQFATALNCICPQEPREPLNLQQFLITIDQIGSFTIGEAVRMGKSLTNLESLVIISAGRNLQISLVPTIVREFHSLKTFVLTTTVPPDELPIVNLSPFRDRHPAINVFIDSRIRHLFTGESDNVKLISLRNEEPGEALQFLQNCNLNGFNFQTQFCLKMMSRSFKSNGVWDFFHIPNDQRHEINIEELDLYNFASEYESEDDYEHEND